MEAPADVRAAPLGAWRQFALSAYWFGFNLVWGAFLIIVVPSQMTVIAPRDPARAGGLLLGCGVVLALVAPLAVGPLSDRCMSRWGRRRPFMVGGTLVTLGGLALTWYAGTRASFWLYFAGYQVIQGGMNTALGAYNGLIPDLVPQSQRGSASGWMAAMTQTGTIAGIVAGMALMHAHRPDAAYAVMAAALVGTLAVTALGVREEPRRTPPEPLDWAGFLRSLWIDPRRYPDFAWVWITRALVTMGLWTVQEFIQYYLVDRAGVPFAEKEMAAGQVLIPALVAATLTGALGGALSDRIGRKRVVYAANLVAAVTCIAFLFSHSLTAAMLLGVVFGLGYGAYYSVDWALGCDVLPSREDAAKDMGVWHIAFVLPQSLGLLIAGPILGIAGATHEVLANGQTVTHYAPAGYTALFGLAAFYMLLGALLLRNVRRAR